MMTNDIKEKYETLKSMCESTLETVVPSGIPVKLASAMRYALLGGGKRLRPVLYLAVLGSYGKAPSDADLKVAAAIECIHSYSLVHDDLPAMDGDLMRRGKPSVHAAYGEAEALLAGDALLNLSFSLLAECACYGGHYAHIMKLVADRCGAEGMIGGQALEIETDLRTADAARLTEIASLKTGMLMEAAAVSGCIAAGREDEADLWREYAHKLGIAFQLRDDILDRGSGENSLAGVLGAGAEAELDGMIADIDEILLRTGGNSEFLRALTSAMLRRTTDEV